MDIIWNKRGSDWLHISSLYGRSLSREDSQAVGQVPRKAVQSLSLEDFKT